MRILVAPDKFKGSLSAAEVGENIASGIREVLPQAEIDVVPLADGGEGTAEIIGAALQGEKVNCSVHDPFSRVIECAYTWIESEKLAVFDMSEAAGWRRVADRHDPFRATTFGVGQMILLASRRGAKRIIVGLGGSGTNDGGFGLARALGFRFFADDDTQLRSAINKLITLKIIEPPQHLSLPKIVAAVDVQNPLLGENGATRVFGPQKGITPEELDVLENALKKLAKITRKELGRDDQDRPGAGAAGGLGFGLMSFAGAVIVPGFEVVAEAVDLKKRLGAADVVVTGEGKLDSQTLSGKAPAGVARFAAEAGKPVWAIVGKATNDPSVRAIFTGVQTLVGEGMTEQQCMEDAASLLRERARELAQIFAETGWVQRG